MSGMNAEPKTNRKGFNFKNHEGKITKGNIYKEDQPEFQSKVENYQVEGLKLWEFIATISSISVLIIHQFLLLLARSFPFVFSYAFISFINFNVAV